MSEWHLRPTVLESCHRWLPRHASVVADVAHEYAGECTSSFLSLPNKPSNSNGPTIANYLRK
jgi:hypothetical protein